MAKRKAPDESLSPSSLVRPRAEVEAQLQERVVKGKELVGRTIQSTEELDQAWKDRERWSSYNTELLLRSFDNRSVADEYNRSIGFGVGSINPSLSQRIYDFRGSLGDRVNRLEAIIERLPLIPELLGVHVPVRQAPTVSESAGDSVFVVHGHDQALREAVARFIERLGLRAVILHEQPSQGRTLLEKFEAHSTVGFAVVILSPDDTCEDRSGAPAYRVRQNVIFELGYFFGALGRQRVAALYVPGVELPTDVGGLSYIEADPKEGWKFHLAKELASAGLPVDKSRLL